MAKKKTIKVKLDSRANGKVIKPYAEFYYIVNIKRDHKNRLKIGVVRKHFQFKDQAKAALDRVISNKEKINYEILKGDEVIYYGLKFRNSSIFTKFTKHDYPIEITTKKLRKQFRLQSKRKRQKGIVLKAEDYNYEPRKKKEQTEKAREKEKQGPQNSSQVPGVTYDSKRKKKKDQNT